MLVKKAVITAAGRNQRSLPHQTLIDRDGIEKSVLDILIHEVVSAGAEAVAVVIAPGDEARFQQTIHAPTVRVQLIPQAEPRGYGHALYCARAFTLAEPFLHLVGDHLYVSASGPGCARQLVEVAQTEACAVSAVQATRESWLPYYGVVGGRRVAGRTDLYQVETVAEKPTPTEAEACLLVPGLRAGHYLGFFGMHVLTPTVMEILGQQLAAAPEAGASLSAALAQLATQEKYLAYEESARRYDLGEKYGLLTAQLALALSGAERAEVLARLLELLAQRELTLPRRPA